MEAIVLAGGFGTRLKGTIGDATPKCMAVVAGKPFLHYILRYLSEQGVTRVILSLGHLSDVVIDWVEANKSQFPLDIDYCIETEPLGTGGGIKLACGHCQESEVVVLNGDTFFDVDLQKLMGKHKDTGSPITIALKRMRDFDRYGAVVVDETSGTILEFKEKSFCQEGDINGGIYVLTPEEVNWPVGRDKFSFEKDVLEKSIGKIRGVNFDGYFIDIGIPDDYAKANKHFAE